MQPQVSPHIIRRRRAWAGSAFRSDEGLGLRVEGLGFRVKGLGWRVSGFARRFHNIGACSIGLWGRLEHGDTI